MANRLNRRPSSWLAVLVLAASVVLFVIHYRSAPPDPENWRWTLFGVGLGLLGAVAGILVAVSVIVRRNRTSAPRTRA